MNELKWRQKKVLESDLSDVEKIYWLLEDCKRYGTLPFAGLARAGFIAVQMLHSMVRVGVLSNAEYECFMASMKTVSSDIQNYISLGKEKFREYGHLRPGTYNILSPRYDEDPDRYFDWENISQKEKYGSLSTKPDKMKKLRLCYGA